MADALRHAGLRMTAYSPAGRAGRRQDGRRGLQLALAGMWLLDAALQYQPVMFTRAFGQTLAATAMGNPAVVAGPIVWVAQLVQQQPVVLNAVFATVQLLFAAGIAWRRTLRVALAASVSWAVAVWWLGEGLGGMLAGMASPVTGAPGAVILYALLAVLLWPADRTGAPAPFTAARAVGARVARIAWGSLWAILASVALWPQNRAPQAMAIQLLGAANGEPGWLAGVDKDAAVLVAQHGLIASVVLAAVLALIGGGVWLPTPAARAVLVLAFLLAAAIWVVGEAFGGVLTGQGTDPNTGPLLALLVLAFWPSQITARLTGQIADAGRRASCCSGTLWRCDPPGGRYPSSWPAARSPTWRRSSTRRPRRPAWRSRSPPPPHFELAGWTETTIVVRFWLIAGMFAALGLWIFHRGGAAGIL